MRKQTICATAGRISSSSQLTAANHSCEQRGQITFWENYTCTNCPSLSSSISNSRLLQLSFIKLMAILCFDLRITASMAVGSLTSSQVFTETVCNWGSGPWEHVKDGRLWSVRPVCTPRCLFNNPHGDKSLFSCKLGGGWSCMSPFVPGVCMTLSLYDDQSSLLFSLPICLSTMFIHGSGSEKAWVEI